LLNSRSGQRNNMLFMSLSAQLLEKYGGSPGKVNATWTEKEDAPVDEKDKNERPLPDADEKYWIYKYG